MEALEGPDAAASLDEARTVWVALAPWPETARETTTARQLEERFQRAVADCERRLARAAEQQAALGHFEQVLATAEAAVADGAFADVRGLWARVQRGWKEAGGATAPPDLVARYRAVEASVAAREQQWREARAREQEELLARMSLICEQAEKLASGADVARKNADRLQRDLRAALGHTQAVYPRRLGEEMAERLRQAQALLLPKLQELRESEEWRRWANAGVQEELCREAEETAHLLGRPRPHHGVGRVLELPPADPHQVAVALPQGEQQARPRVLAHAPRRQHGFELLEGAAVQEGGPQHHVLNGSKIETSILVRAVSILRQHRIRMDSLHLDVHPPRISSRLASNPSA